MSGQIFISYRREDTAGFAGRLYDRLHEHFPQHEIFMDVDSIDPGLDFVEAIEAGVGSCDLLLALIGTQWLNASDQEGRRRLDNPEDSVRLEIATALKRGIRVIPLLVEGAVMPRSVDLPEELKPLARRQALSVSPDRFLDDSEPLIATLQRALETVRSQGRCKREGQGRVEAERREREGNERQHAQRREKGRLEFERRQEEGARLRAEAQTRTEQERLEAKRRRREEPDRLEAQSREREEKERLELVGRHPALESLLPKADLSAAGAHPGAEPLPATRKRLWRLPVVIGGAIAIALLAFSLLSKPSRPSAASVRESPLPTPSPLAVAAAASNSPGSMALISEASPNPTASVGGASPSPAPSVSQAAASPTPAGAEGLDGVARYLDAEDDAMALLQKAAAAGDAESMNQLGELYYRGRGIVQDYGRARDWYRKAAEAGNATAMNNLGNLYYHGLGVARDYSQARRWYQKAAEAGDADAKQAPSRLPSMSSPIPLSSPTPSLSQASPTPTPSGADWFAEAKRYLDAKDYANALPPLQKAAEASNTEAMGDLGSLYYFGHGVARDYAQARRWYQKAAGAGDSGAMSNLGNLYYHGQGVTQDYGQARRWYEKAAEAGNERAMNNLGNLYYHRLGVAQDYGQARQWYQRAAEAGDAWGMRNLGWLYENGYGVTQDYGQARRWYQKARDAGNPDAKYLLSRLPSK